MTVLLQTSGRVRHMPFPACLNPSPLQFDLRAVRCHLLGLPFLQNFRQLTVAHSARMCHNSFAVIYFSQTYFTTNKKPRLPFWVVSTSCSFQAVLLQPLLACSVLCRFTVLFNMQTPFTETRLSADACSHMSARPENGPKRSLIIGTVWG